MAFRHSLVWGTAGLAAILLAVGCSGSDGATGPQGPAGPAGTAGKDGAVGTNGTDGVDGKDGAKGADGANGADGKDGANGADGKDGTNGVDGTNGTDGKDGVNGDAGAPGKDGVDGMNVAVEQRHGLAALEAMDLAEGKWFVDATITSATADDQGVVTVEYKVMGKDGKPVPGLPGAYFNISKLAPPKQGETFGNWVAYIYRTETVKGAGFPKPDGTMADQAYRENTGTTTDHGDGTYTYVFKNNISAVSTPVAKTPVTYDRALLHRVAIMMGGHSGATASAHLDFVPNGGQAPATRDIVQTASCNNCHTSITGHGGDRIGLENCMTCHQDGSFDAQTGHSIDMKVMIHKIHAGAELASIPGADGIVFDNPATAVDESADNGNYTLYGNKDTPHTWWKAEFPAILANCTKCHDGKGKDVGNWKDVPSRAACGSCHDTINWATGANHKGGKATSDTGCTNCHGDGGMGGGVEEAHNWVTKDPRKVMEFDPVMTVTGAANGKFFVKGEKPVVHIKLTDRVTKALIDHTTMVVDDAVTAIPPGSGPEGCVPKADGSACTVARDGKFTGSGFYVAGPRAQRSPVLTTKARVVTKNTTGAATFNLASATGKTTLGVVVDNGQDIFADDGKLIVPASITVPVYATGPSGEVTTTPAWTVGASTTTFTDASQYLLGASKTWVDHAYAGYTITVTNNSVSGKPTATYTVLDNVGATMTVNGVWTYLPTDILSYTSFGFAGSTQGKATGGSATTVADTTAKWTVDQWKGFTVKIVSGTGAGQAAAITGNTATTLSFAALATAPDATSIYSIQRFADVSKATPTEVVAWLNGYAPFAARAQAYVDPVGTALADVALAAIPVGGTTFSIKANNGQMFPLSGSVILDRFTPAEETLTFTRATDTFTIAAATKAHNAGASIRVNVPSTVTIRSRNLGDFFGLQVSSASVVAAAALFPADVVGNYPVHVLGSNTVGATSLTGTASTVSNLLAKPTDPFADDPKITRTKDEIIYTLDPVDDLAPGTYIAKIEVNDRGNKITDVDFQTPTVAQVAFQVGTATEEKPPANNCGSCHTDPTDTKGFVLDFVRHNKLFNNVAVDSCGTCHDYQQMTTSGGIWPGAIPISQRVHAVHAGANLHYPNQTVSHEDGVPGRDWQIVYPTELRTCDANCHGPTTSGTWKTKPARLPCMGCHDSDAAQAHIRGNTFDPTPANPFSGDEREACQACHAPAE